jgi:hypothetical protein
MKETYKKPEMEVLKIDVEDVIVLSDPPDVEVDKD